jgi:membrane associated rhomboid family serine protease
MPSSSSIILLIIIANFIISYKGFTDKVFFDGYKFQVENILVKKDYIRLISNGFLHLDWQHLIFNMLSLYLFGGELISDTGIVPFFIIYFVSLLGGALLSLYIHRNHADYHSAGASGAVCGVLFAFIAIHPDTPILFFLPAWLYGIVYVLYTIYGIKANKGNIGHDAHLGGALAGLFIFLVFKPSVFLENYIVILLIAIPCIAFIVYTVKHPEHLIIGGFGRKADPVKTYSIDHKYNLEKSNQEREVDRILDKINDRGIESLTKKEKEHLKRFS